MNPVDSQRDREIGCTESFPFGQAKRRGPLLPGDRVQITDTKGRMHTVVLVPGGRFHSSRGTFDHDTVLGKPDGQIVNTEGGRTFQVIRPLLTDYVLSMPRGAAIIYPKDSAQIVQMADIFPGAKVLEAGTGSGALTLTLLSAIGNVGRLCSVEKREDFAAIARANVDLWFGVRHPAWELHVTNLGEFLDQTIKPKYDRIVLDLLDPWTYVNQVASALEPGGVFCCYVTTVTQMSRLVETIRCSSKFTQPQAWDTTNRQWHVEGLAVRPEHRMIGHTGYIVLARYLACGMQSSMENRNPVLLDSNVNVEWDENQNWDKETLGVRHISDRKVRRVRRDVEAKRNYWVPGVN